MESKLHFSNKRLLSGNKYRRLLTVASFVVMSFFVFDGLSSSGKPEKQSVHEQIDTKIEKYIEDQYEKEIFPDCRKFAAMPASYDKLRAELNINNKLTLLLEKVTEYGEELSGSYKGEKDYILSKIDSYIDFRQAEVFRLKFPDGDPDWTHGFVLDPDSAYRICIELEK
ncbi:MAG: hypothetical protein K2G77_09085 [Muribaculaceae bacterium]|nr:hypothetical protein [Muribaculaceae bacterium]